MSIGYRYGIAVGCALIPLMFGLLYGYHAPDLPIVPAGTSVWLWMVAPALAWVAVETATRIRQQARLLGQTLLVVGLIPAGIWWWWLHGLYVWRHHAPAADTAIAIPSAIVLVVLALAGVSGHLLARPVNTVRVNEYDHIRE